MVIEKAEKSLYGSGQISLPTPQCIVFYNGVKEITEERTLKLSDDFENKKVRADVELTVRLLNINYGHNKQLMEKCRILGEYSKLAAVIRDCMAVEKDMQTALNQAVDSCIEKGILKEFLLKNRAEVLGMLLEEFDAEKYERTIRSEGREEGKVEVNRLGLLLTEAGRSDEFLKSLSDRELQKKLFVEFGLEKDDYE